MLRAVALAGVLAATTLPLCSAFHSIAPHGVGVALRASRGASTSPRTPGAALVAPRLRGGVRGVLPVQQHAGRAARRHGLSLAMQSEPEVEEKEETAQVNPISFNEEGGLRLFGIDATAEVMAISIVYFVQGILGISRLAVSYYYKVFPCSCTSCLTCCTGATNPNPHRLLS